MLKTTPKTWDLLLGENCWYYHHQWWFTTLTLTSTCTRTVFVVMALSFHSTIEGLALALEDEASGVWLNTGVHCNFGWTPVDFAILFEHRCQFQFWLNTGQFCKFGWTQVSIAISFDSWQSFSGATALHKFVISFSVGMELVSNKVVHLFCFCIFTWPSSLCVWSRIKKGVTSDVLHLHRGVLPRPSTRLGSRYRSYWGTF